MDVQEITKTIKQLDIVTNRKVNEVFAGNYKSSFKGRGLEVADLREYESGDDFRYIDWITTAKQGKLFVKKFQETRELSTMIVLDTSASMNFGTYTRNKKQTALELAAILLFSALKNNDKFGSIIFSDNKPHYIPPKKGKAHLFRILSQMISNIQSNHYKATKPENAFSLLNTIVPKNTICFYLTDEFDDDHLPYLKIANQKHDFVFAWINDLFESNLIYTELLEIEDPETGQSTTIDLANTKTKNQFMELRRNYYDSMKNQLNQNKIDLLNIRTDSNLFKELLMFFRKRQAKY